MAGFRNICTSAIALMVLSLFISGCNRFEYSPYQVLNQEYTELNAKSIEQLVDNGSDTIRLAVIGDSQRFFESTETIIDKINDHTNVDFVVHTGDIVDFGIQREYDWMHELLSTLNSPYLPVVGNHDLIGNGDEIYKAMYGPLDFSFVFMGTKFIFINSNSREFSFNDEVPIISWLSGELADTASYGQAVAVMHIPPQHEDFNSSLRIPFEAELTQDNRTILAINGHRHNFGFDIYESGLPYLNSFSTTQEMFILLKIWPGGFSYTTM